MWLTDQVCKLGVPQIVTICNGLQVGKIDSVPVLVVCSPSPNLTDDGASHVKHMDGKWHTPMITHMHKQWIPSSFSLSFSGQGVRLHWPYNPQTNSETASGVEQEAWYPPPYLLNKGR